MISFCLKNSTFRIISGSFKCDDIFLCGARLHTFKGVFSSLTAAEHCLFHHGANGFVFGIVLVAAEIQVSVTLSALLSMSLTSEEPSCNLHCALKAGQFALGNDQRGICILLLI